MRNVDELFEKFRNDDLKFVLHRQKRVIGRRCNEKKNFAECAYLKFGKVAVERKI